MGGGVGIGVGGNSALCREFLLGVGMEKKKRGVGGREEGGGLRTLVPVKERGGINEAIKAPGSLRGIVGGRAG